jgi:hypothetical protein
VVQLLPAAACWAVAADVEGLLLREGGAHGVFAVEVVAHGLLERRAARLLLLLLLLVLT